MPDLRVAHLPARTPYARKLASDGISLANRDGDDSPIPIDLTFRRLAEGGADGFDVLHVHTVELASEAEVSRALERCRERGQGVVATMHDLSPCFDHSESEFERKVDLVAGQAAGVVTLTTGAADDLRRRFAGRPWLDRVEVVPHGRVVAPNDIRRDRRVPGGPVRYGLLGSFRPSRDTWTAMVNWYYALQDEDATLTLLTRGFDPGRLHDERLRMADILNFAQLRDPRIRVVVRPQPADDEVARFIQSTDVLLLPYTFGSHSGQLELAFDAGAVPLSGDVGFLREQAEDAAPHVRHQPVWFDWSDGSIRRYGGRFCEALLEAHARAQAAPPWNPEPVDAWRTAQHEQILAAHARIYAAASG